MLELLRPVYLFVETLSFAILVVIKLCVTLVTQVCHKYVVWLLAFTLSVGVAAQPLVVGCYNRVISLPAIHARLSPRCREEFLAANWLVLKNFHLVKNQGMMKERAVQPVPAEPLALEVPSGLEVP